MKLRMWIGSSSFDISEEKAVLENDVLKIDLRYYTKKGKRTNDVLQKLSQNNRIYIFNNRCYYKVASISPVKKQLGWRFWDINLMPDIDLHSQTIEYNIDFHNVTFNFDNVTNNIEWVVDSVSNINDREEIRKLIQEILESQELKKTRLEKFKDVILRNTDVLGLFAQIILAIISH